MFSILKVRWTLAMIKHGKNITFFSPAYFQLGPGMLWKKKDNLSVNFSPATSKLILVHNHFTDFGPSFGVYKAIPRFEFGASITAYYKFIIMANVSIENRLNLYSNYLDDPQNVDRLPDECSHENQQIPDGKCCFTNHI
jgi:hypothetical protein